MVNGDWWPEHPGRGPRPTLALYRNQGNGTFSDATATTGLAVSLQGMGVAAGDYDNDGFDDLFVTAAGGSRLFHNQPSPGGSRRAGVANPGGKSLGVCVYDLEGAGRPDLLVANDTEPNFCYRNNGNGTFTDVALAAGLAVAENGNPRAGMGIDSAVYDADGAV